MNPMMISSLRNRSKLIKSYYSNITEKNKNLLSAKSKKCSKIILKDSKGALTN